MCECTPDRKGFYRTGWLGAHFHCRSKDCPYRTGCWDCPISGGVPDPNWYPTKADLVLGRSPPILPYYFFGQRWYGLLGLVWGVFYMMYSFGQVFWVLLTSYLGATT